MEPEHSRRMGIDLGVVLSGLDTDRLWNVHFRITRRPALNPFIDMWLAGLYEGTHAGSKGVEVQEQSV